MILVLLAIFLIYCLCTGKTGLSADSKPFTHHQLAAMSSDLVDVLKIVFPSLFKYDIDSREAFDAIDVVELLIGLKGDYDTASIAVIIVACSGGR